MTDDYTPSLNEVRADYVAIHTRNFDSYATGRSLTSEQEFYASQFDRWLASHDADVAERIAQAWDEGYQAHEDEYWCSDGKNPYRATPPEIPGLEGTRSALDGLTIRKEQRNMVAAVTDAAITGLGLTVAATGAVSGYTSHGHRIAGVVQTGRPASVARCGGPGLCTVCSREAATTYGEGDDRG